MLIRYAWVLTSVLLISACSEKTDWIEVPLQDNTYYPQEENYKVKHFDIPVKADEGLEFKLSMQEGDSIVYHWDVEIDLAALLTVEFHGHTEREANEPGTVMFYKRHKNGKEEGSLVAPFDGIHGWYFRNDSGNEVVVKLSVAGFFTEVE